MSKHIPDRKAGRTAACVAGVVIAPSLVILLYCCATEFPHAPSLDDAAWYERARGTSWTDVGAHIGALAVGAIFIAMMPLELRWRIPLAFLYVPVMHLYLLYFELCFAVTVGGRYL
jgi:hypothetical protein